MRFPKPPSKGERLAQLKEVHSNLDFADIMLKRDDSGVYSFAGTVVPVDGETSTIRGDGYTDLSECAESASVAILGVLRRLHQAKKMEG